MKSVVLFEPLNPPLMGLLALPDIDQELPRLHF
jgi:hypothetical protein